MSQLDSVEESYNSLESPELIVKEGRAIVRLDCNEITWLESGGNYTTINLYDAKRRVVRIPISELQQQLSAKQFVRIHKSYLINKKYITEIRTNSVLIQDQELPVGRAFQSSMSLLFK